MIDSKRFPRVASDLRELRPTTDPGRYAATGDVTLAGRSRRYNGTLTLSSSGDRITIEGELEIDIRDFGLKPPALLLIKVDPAVKLRSASRSDEVRMTGAAGLAPRDRRKENACREKRSTSRFEIASADSSLTFFATSPDAVRLWEDDRAGRLCRCRVESGRDPCARAGAEDARRV